MEQVHITKLRPGMVLAQDLFLESQPTTAFMRRGAIINEKTIERLRHNGFLSVLVETNVETLTPKVSVAPARPGSACIRTQKPVISDSLRKEAVDTLEEAFTSVAVNDNGFIGSEKSFKKLGGVVGHLVDSLVGNRKLLVNINGLKSYDDYTYHHSLSVAVLSIGIGQELGISYRQLNRLGLCAIMHDIGKISVPIEIIRKPARLSDSEFRLIQTHSRAGTNYLKSISAGDEALWRSVLFHHEKMDGSGYPTGLRGERIPLWSRIISVADVFDALTSTRPYRLPMQPSEAIEYIMGGVGSSFDFDVVTALVRKVDLYPVGSMVMLSDKSVAVVLDNRHQLRPVVEILGNGRVVDLFDDRHYLNITITKTIEDSLPDIAR